MLSLFKRKHHKNNRQIENNINIKIVINTCCNDVENKLQTLFLKSKTGRFYDINKVIYEKENKGIYIIKSYKTDKKYILKIKENKKTNYFEEDIYNILSKNFHKNVTRFISFTEEYGYFYSIYEYADGCNLLEYIKLKGDLLESEIRNILKQIVSALSFLHNHSILHCDLKLENIIINTASEIKIIDFDLSIVCDNDEGFISNSIFGTLKYIAPESYDLSIYSKKTDIWQLGVLLYIMITRKFPHDNEISLVNSYSNLCRQNVFKHIDLNIPKEVIIKKNFDLSLYNLLEKMLSFDEKNRWEVSDIMDSEWMKNR